jgi:hypothetical protein
VKHALALSLLGRLLFVSVTALVGAELVPSQLAMIGRALCGVLWIAGAALLAIDAASKEPVIPHDFAAGFVMTVATFFALAAKLPAHYRKAYQLSQAVKKPGDK